MWGTFRQANTIWTLLFEASGTENVLLHKLIRLPEDILPG